jgi:hypothetical protein
MIKIIDSLLNVYPLEIRLKILDSLIDKYRKESSIKLNKMQMEKQIEFERPDLEILKSMN